MSKGTKSFNRSALVIAHPGHELRVYGWVVEARPQIHVLTDGSGSTGISRIPSTRSLAENIQATCGEIFPAGTDRELYQAMLKGNAPFFIALAERLAHSFAVRGTDFVGADAADGFNPAHDLCRAVVDLAITLAECSTGKPIANYQFRLADTKGGPAAAQDGDCLHCNLDDEVFTAKLRAAEGYSGLSEEVSRALDRVGRDYFRHEYLCPVKERFRFDGTEAPYYEEVGQARIGTGDYASVIRRDTHIDPIIAALRDRSLKPARV